MTSVLRAAACQVDITCAPGVPLGGNVRADKANRGVHDPLWASILLLDDGRAPWALVSLDLLCTTASLTAQVAASVSAGTGLDPGRVVVCATHTHSGPDVLLGGGWDRDDYGSVQRWAQDIQPRIEAAARQLWQERVAVTLRRGRAQVEGVAFNRRLERRDGCVAMNWEPVDPADILGPLGPIDPTLDLLTVHDPHGAVLGAVLHFTLHPAVLVGHDWLVSADWVARARARVSTELGAGTPVLVLNGALGDINHLDYHTPGRAIGFAEADRIGDRIGSGAVTAAAASRDCPPHTWLHTIRVDLGQRTVTRELLAHAHTVLAQQEGQPVDALDGIPAPARACWLVQRGRYLPPLVEVRIDLIRIGDLTLVALPFEVFVSFGLSLAQRFPDRAVRVVSLTSDYLGYLPTAAAFAQGGYEPTFGTSTIEAGQGEYLFETIVVHLRALLDARHQQPPPAAAPPQPAQPTRPAQALSDQRRLADDDAIGTGAHQQPPTSLADAGQSRERE